MQRIAHFIHQLQHFIYADHKAEVFVGISSAAVTGAIGAHGNADLIHELAIRNINTAIMTVIGACIGFFVTMGLKKIFDKK